MLSGATTLIIGAGSSVDFEMPVGAALAADICQRLAFSWEHTGVFKSGDPLILAALRERFPGESYRPFIAAAQKLAAVLPGFASIDDCLYTHGEDERVRLVGKLAIARIIAERENRSWLADVWGLQPDVALAKIQGGWAQGLARILATGLRASDRNLLFNNLTMITFNYDRCAETAFFHCVKKIFHVGDQEAAETMAALRIVRPYGGLGLLPWAGREGEPFGNQAPDLFALAERIQVYTDDQGERPDLELMRQTVAQSANVIALGFGFHPLNMRLLRAPRPNGDYPKSFATAVGEPGPRRIEIAERIQQTFGTPIPLVSISSGTCTQLVAQYGGQFSG